MNIVVFMTPTKPFTHHTPTCTHRPQVNTTHIIYDICVAFIRESESAINKAIGLLSHKLELVKVLIVRQPLNNAAHLRLVAIPPILILLMSPIAHSIEGSMRKYLITTLLPM